MSRSAGTSPTSRSGGPQPLDEGLIQTLINYLIGLLDDEELHGARAHAARALIDQLRDLRTTPAAVEPTPLLFPTHFTIKEGGVWNIWPPDQVSECLSVKYNDGRIWDRRHGFRQAAYTKSTPTLTDRERIERLERAVGELYDGVQTPNATPAARTIARELASRSKE